MVTVTALAHADVAAAFVGGAVAGGFLGILYGMSVAFAIAERWHRRRRVPLARTLRLPLARTMPLRRPPE